jgi:hypothetical protein
MELNRTASSKQLEEKADVNYMANMIGQVIDNRVTCCQAYEQYVLPVVRCYVLPGHSPCNPNTCFVSAFVLVRIVLSGPVSLAAADTYLRSCSNFRSISIYIGQSVLAASATEMNFGRRSTVGSMK